MFSFASLASLNSNTEAIEAALLFCAGHHPLAAIVGPSGWGKSHLLQAISNRLAIDGILAEPMSVHEFLANSGRADAPALLLDDVQDVLGKPRLRLDLRLALEKRARNDRHTFLAFTAPRVTRQIRGFLPEPRKWAIATMVEPVAEERAQLLAHMAKAEGLSLSPRLVRILAEQMLGNGRTFVGALKRLRMAGPNWMDADQTLRALGILDPFFTDNGSWDLKHKILRVAEGSKAQFTRSIHIDLALYTMLQAGLGEADVARAAKLSPAEVYQRAGRFRKQMETCDITPGYVGQFVELVVGSLARD